MTTGIMDAGRDVSGGYKVDVSRGGCVDRVSSEWFSRSDDERYLSLDDLFASVKGRAERSRTRGVEVAAIPVEAHRDDPEKLGLVLPGAEEPVAPTHWSFGQLSSLVGAPAAYLRQLVDGHLQPARGRDEGADDAPCLRPRRVALPRFQ